MKKNVNRNLLIISIITINFLLLPVAGKVVKLHCKYCNYGISEGTDFEETCDLIHKEEITREMEDGTAFEFTGVPDDQKNNVKTLAFRNDHIAFVPAEAFTTFPHLERITMLNTSLGSLDHIWLTNFLKHEKNIKFLDFRWNKINRTDPQVLAIFANYQKVNLRWNLCIDKKYTIVDGDIIKMKIDLDKCIHHFYNTDTFYVAGRLAMETMKVAEETRDQVNDLQKQIEELQKSVNDLLNICHYNNMDFVGHNGRPKHDAKWRRP